MSGGRVVVGLDPGAPSADALAFALAWCRSSGDHLLVVAVHPGAAAAGAQRVDAEWAAFEREDVERRLEEVRAAIPADVSAQVRRLDASSAAHGLSELSEENEPVALIVLGTRRSGERFRTSLGSTAERVFSGAAAPVAIVPRGYAGAAPERLRRLTVAFVDTEDGRTALTAAVGMTNDLSAGLRVVTVVPDTRVTPAMGEPSRFGSAQHEDYRRALEEAVAPLDGAAETLILEGPVAETLAELDPAETDVLVTGSRGYGPVRRVLLGGVSTRVVRQARVPVVVVPRAAR